MNDRYLFRGKRLDNGEWVEGYLLPRLIGGQKSWYISQLREGFSPNTAGQDYQIDPSTIGQYTGFRDKNGKRIFEGDTMPWSEDDENYTLEVRRTESGTWKLFDISDGLSMGILNETLQEWREVTGTIHDK